jgi:hypothetical protein
MKPSKNLPWRLLQVIGFAIPLALTLAQSARAAAVFDNGAPNLVSGTQMTEFRVAENFTLPSAADIGNIRFWSVQSAASDHTGSVAWSISSHSGAQPGAELFSGLASVTGVVSGGSTGFGYLAYVFDIPVTFSLLAGDFWLTLHNGPLNDIDPLEMLWATTSIGSAPSGLYLDGSTWVDTGNEHAFRLDGEAPITTVPIPASALLLLVGLVGLSRTRYSNFKK